MPYGSGLRTLFPNLSYQCDPQVELVVAEMPPDSVMLDVGAGGRRLHKKMTTVDFVDSGDTDIVCDVTAIPLPDGEVDLIVATGILEHVENEDLFLTECARLLKPGGVLHVEVPFMQQYHDDPIDMRRYTSQGLVALLSRYQFDARKSGFHMGPSVAIITLNAYYVSILFGNSNVVAKALSNLAFMLFSLIGWPLKYLDRYLMRREQAHRIAFGVYATVIKN